MSRQLKVRQMTYGSIISASGLLLIILPQIPFIRSGLSLVLILLGLFQLREKNKKASIILIAVGVGFYFLYGFIMGSVYLLGILLLLLGIGLAVIGWKKNS